MGFGNNGARKFPNESAVNFDAMAAASGILEGFDGLNDADEPMKSTTPNKKDVQKDEKEKKREASVPSKKSAVSSEPSVRENKKTEERNKVSKKKKQTEEQYRCLLVLPGAVEPLIKAGGKYYGSISKFVLHMLEEEFKRNGDTLKSFIVEEQDSPEDWWDKYQ